MPFNNEPQNSQVNGGRSIKSVINSLVLVIVVVFVAWLAFTIVNKNSNNSFLSPNPDLYQAVFLANGEVYFGHITEKSEEALILEDIYYIKVTQGLQQLSPEGVPVEAPQQLNLIKLGEELHGPEDKMYIPINSVIYWENISADGQVATAIAEAQAQELEPEQSAGNQSQSADVLEPTVNNNPNPPTIDSLAAPEN